MGQFHNAADPNVNLARVYGLPQRMASNLISIRRQSVTEHRDGPANHIWSVNSSTSDPNYYYDVGGNLVWAEGHSYTYDAENRLVLSGLGPGLQYCNSEPLILRRLRKDASVIGTQSRTPRMSRSAQS